MTREDPHLVIFDWNGTVQDDLHHIYECGVQRIFREFGVPCPTVEQFRDEVSADFMNSFYWPHGIPKTATADDLNVIMKAGYDEKGTPPALFPDAVHVIRSLGRLGYLLAVSSAYARGKLDAAIERAGLQQAFLRADSDVRDKKESFTSLIDLAGVPAENVTVIGDSESDALGAAAIGALPIIVTRGYAPPERMEKLRPQVPRMVLVDTLTDALRLLRPVG